MSSTSSNEGQMTDNAESTPNHVVATASQGSSISDTGTEIDSTPQSPTLAPGHATPDEQLEVHLTPLMAEGTLPPEHEQAAAPAADAEPALPDDVDDNHAISPLMKGAGGIPGILIDDADENN
ncbi:hypothetical protein FRC10_010431 [Ceratobasidium sp. 414]|nr:hypothetical protein FRC10_010431 [Ceratobasidium sp. 414]